MIHPSVPKKADDVLDDVHLLDNGSDFRILTAVVQDTQAALANGSCFLFSICVARNQMKKISY